jgi:2-polyprenyl-6-methoxyphenol hydroxylase-like FAD-dependent oxidoreductase
MVWRAVVDRPCEQVTFWLGDECFVGACPIAAARTYVFVNVAQPRHHDSVVGRRDRLRCRFHDFDAAARRLLDAVVDDAALHCSPIEWLPTMASHTDRTILIGDAAHACSPMMGQGGSMAIEDGVALADELCRAPDIATALEQFTHRLLKQPPAERDHHLRAAGRAAFRSRFEPLRAPS